MAVSNTLKVSSGHPMPYGPTILGPSVNFSIYAPYAQIVRLYFFDYQPENNMAQPCAEITLNTSRHRTGDVWHVQVAGLPDKVLYSYQIDEEGLILDPYSPEVWSGGLWGGVNQLTPDQKKHYQPLSFINQKVSVSLTPRPRIPFRDLVIYEMHVRGFTRHPSSKVAHPGTYSGVIEKIADIRDLGFNAIELMPIQEFNELSRCESLIQTQQTLLNYWGYSPASFFAPMNRFASRSEPGAAAEELRVLVNTCHKHRIEVILDVVFNHTDWIHPTRALDKEHYYILDERGNDTNYSGCGNTFSCNAPLSIDLILSALRNWVVKYGVDGFRFDLASIMTRDRDGTPMSNPPLIQAINADPVLKETKLIAEPWDAAGLYHTGSFPAHEGRWAEWNGQYRDAVRRFIKGTEHSQKAYATAICGSEPLYRDERKPYHSINFVTCHDGFSLKDLVTYQEKHNENNGEGNRDGNNCSENWNCGTEGETEDEAITQLRERQIRNFIAALMLSQGVPLWRMGDERGHTQFGNNNSWCQDNELSWLDWDRPISDFAKKMIALRKKSRILRQPHFLTGQDIQWHDPKWDQDNRTLVWTLKDHENNEHLFVAFNASHKKQELTLPKPPSRMKWIKITETGQGTKFLPPYSAVIFKATPLH